MLTSNLRKAPLGGQLASALTREKNSTLGARSKHFLRVIGALEILGKQQFLLGAPACIRGKLSQVSDDVEKGDMEQHWHCVGDKG